MPSDDWDSSFGAVLARLRHAARMTQEQLADRADLSVRAISSLECGARLPRRLTLDRLAAALDLTLAQRAELKAAAADARRPTAPAGGLLPVAGPAGPMVGRRTERAELQAHLTGDGPVALAYDGELGLGKSRLLSEAIALGTRAGIPVLAATGRRGADPYGPVVEALADHVRRCPPTTLAAQLRGCAGLDLVLPELAGRVPAVPGAGQRRLAFDAAGRFLDHIAGSGRLLLVLDDLQWAGPQAAELLGYLVRRSWSYLRVVIACRPGDLAPPGQLGEVAAELARLHLLRGRRLAPLPPDEADALVTATAAGIAGGAGRPAAALTPARRGRILRRSGGLPLFLVELTRAALAGTVADLVDRAPSAAGAVDAVSAASARPGGGAGSGGGTARVGRPPGTRRERTGPDGDELPWHLRLAVLHQLAVLPEPAVGVLRRMALAGPTVTAEALAGPQWPAEQVLDHLDAARRHRILDETRRGFRFRYPLVREVLATGLGPNRRRLWRAGGQRYATGPGTGPATGLGTGLGTGHPAAWPGQAGSADVGHPAVRTA